MFTLLRLFRSLSPYRWQMAALLVSLVLVTATSLVTPSIIQSVIDDGLVRRDPQAMLNAGIVVVVIGLLRALFNFVKRYLGEWIINRVGYDVRNNLYDKIQRLSFGYHDHTQTGQLMSRCTEDVSALSRFLGQGSIELLNVILLLAGIVILLWRENVMLTIIILLPLIMLALVTYRLGTLMSKRFLEVDQALGEVSATLQENLSGVQVVRAFAREEFEKEKFARVNDRLFDARVTIVNMWGTYLPTMTILVWA